MRSIALAAGLTALAVTPGLAADPHPWCMIYQDMSGATACYYDSYDQCRVGAAGGNGGTCLQNPAYREPRRTEPAASRKPRRSR
jgi:uncharacterized protein DUF3551